jgi:hypothetical protein
MNAVTDCVVCEPAWVLELSASAGSREFWQALPCVELGAGQAWAGDPECVAAWWVEGGLLATVFSDAQGRERVQQFHPSGHWLAPLTRLSGQVWRIEAQVLSRVRVLSKPALEQAIRCDARVADWLLQALMAERERLTAREHQWLMLSATERYLHLLQTAPAWMQQVPQHRLASFLGVTDVALSRIRRRLKSLQQNPS